MREYKHLVFKKNWELNSDIVHMLGECAAYIDFLNKTPMEPSERKKMLIVSLRKGALATTAIEGNTMTQEELDKIDEGWKVPESKEYLRIEIDNVINALNDLLKEVVISRETNSITPDLIRRFHKMVSSNLGEHLDAIPGKFREDRRQVGKYLTPDHRDVEKLLSRLCDWLKTEFGYSEKQSFQQAIIEAIVAHVYLEWIHPFGDGNGRTGRLLEFYILLRAGMPNIASHILSNHYNETRSEYYRQFDKARQNNDLTGFIRYSLQGLRDGLKVASDEITNYQMKVFWKYHIHEEFSKIAYTKKDAFKRKRELMLSIPLTQCFATEEITNISPEIARAYAKVSKQTLLKDLNEMVDKELLERQGNKFCANNNILVNALPSRKQ